MEILGISLQSLLILPLTLLSFAALLMLIVFIHEYGHFKVARLLGVRVDVFSIGFGKAIVKWVDRKGTEWRLAPIPLGGYVKFFGDLNVASQGSPEVVEQAQSPQSSDAPAQKPMTTQFPTPGQEEAIAAGLSEAEKAVCFHFKPVWARALIVAAGPFANFILSIVIFAALFMAFGRPIVQPIIGTVSPDSAAEVAGFEVGDEFVSLNGQKISQFDQLRDGILLSGGGELEFVVERAGRQIPLTATPRRVEDTDRYGNKIELWLLGVAPSADAYSFQRYGPIAALGQGVREVGRLLNVTVRYLGKIITGRENADQLSGPIKMAKYAGQSAMSGFDESNYREAPGLWKKLRASLVDFIGLAAVVSVSIGFLNLLPIPVLDGGHLMYYAYEALVGKPLGPQAQAMGFRVGIALMASLMIFVTWNDINSLISSLS